MVLLIRFGDDSLPPIEPFLARLVGEFEIEASPRQALKFWSVLADIRPDWPHACIKAADLALAAGELDRCAGWIATATTETRRNHWYWDIAARHAVETGAIAMAMDYWGKALALVPPELAEVFRQRRREARRGVGVMQARSLLDGGDAVAALDLLQRLVAEDPEWQPLRSLLLQAETIAGPIAGNQTDLPGKEELHRFSQFLARAAARVGIPLHPIIAKEEVADRDLDACRQDLERFSGSLGEAEARFALES
ncbi:MAG: hypothetical protein ER33_05240 [Cyanobium sp. CACIAM 14]|nr:MAG: hypothetical protein ER33_05240 [Cyanobium sp. CACIAM 14]